MEAIINAKAVLPDRVLPDATILVETGRIHVEFAPSYEESGPFGAKSIGEIVINTPAPAIAHALYRATGIWYRDLPVLPERIALDLAKKE